MQFLTSVGIAFAGALACVLVAMLVAYWLGLAPFQIWLAIGIATGSALGFVAKTGWQLSRGTGAVIIGLFVGLGSVVGHWLSVHA